MKEFEKKYRVEASRFYYDYADGLAIVIDSATGIYYGMNVLGSAVFDQLAHGASPDAVLEQLIQVAGQVEGIESMFTQFFYQVRALGLLQPDEEPGRGAAPFEQKITDEGVCLEVKEFAEIQEILLADPIHDVHSDFGWPFLKNE